jgi:putative NIF3 family GTP cyclohydrolase 1 type 2
MPKNNDINVGLGMTGELNKLMSENEFIDYVKLKFNINQLRHSKLLNRSVKEISVLGGSGSFAIEEAIKAGSDVFLTSDLKYHDFFKAENDILLLDIGHYESEQYTKKLIHTHLTKKITNFAIVLSDINTNPVKYS